LDAAYELFSRRGIQASGIDDIIARSKVAKASFYRNFTSKDELVLAFLADREQRWTHGFVEAEARRLGGDDVEARLLAIFDVFDGWFRNRAEFDACSFINVLLEMGADHPTGQACIQHLANIRAVVAGWARDAGLREPEEFARSWHILMKGSIISAVEGDTEAARRAQVMARFLIGQYRSDASA
jgi:AcrR family transcriptional regulator